MAKLSSINNNLKRQKMILQFKSKRAVLKDVIMSKTTSFEERFKAQQKLAEFPRNSAANRSRRRCELTGRSKGNLRKFGLSRIKFRELASCGQLPGVTKASW